MSDKTMADDRMLFHIWCAGDPSVGIWGQEAEVRFWVDQADPEQIQFAREQLAACFSAIWGERAHVMTGPELQAEQDEERALAAEQQARADRPHRAEADPEETDPCET